MIKLIVLLTRFVFTACLQQEISSLRGVAQPAVCNGGVLSIGRVFPRELVYSWRGVEGHRSGMPVQLPTCS